MIQQVAFDMPDYIEAGIRTGKYIQYGGVIRDNAGRIVKHLKPVDAMADTNKAPQIARRAANLAKQNKKISVVALTIAGVAAVGGVAYGAIKHIQHQRTKKAHDEAMDFFNEALSEYLEALNEQRLSIEVIDNLEAAIAGLNDGGEGFTVEIEGKQFENLVKSIYDYTNRLSKANGIKKPHVIARAFSRRPNDLNGLKECLMEQREMFNAAA